jgi:hypothetical protein
VANGNPALRRVGTNGHSTTRAIPHIFSIRNSIACTDSTIRYRKNWSLFLAGPASAGYGGLLT